MADIPSNQHLLQALSFSNSKVYIFAVGVDQTTALSKHTSVSLLHAWYSQSQRVRRRKKLKRLPSRIFENSSLVFPLIVSNAQWIMAWYEVPLDTLFVADPQGKSHRRSGVEAERYERKVRVADVEPQLMTLQENGVDCGVFFVCAYALMIDYQSLVSPICAAGCSAQFADDYLI